MSDFCSLRGRFGLVFGFTAPFCLFSRPEIRPQKGVFCPPACAFAKNGDFRGSNEGFESRNRFLKPARKTPLSASTRRRSRAPPFGARRGVPRSPVETPLGVGAAGALTARTSRPSPSALGAPVCGVSVGCGGVRNRAIEPQGPAEPQAGVRASAARPASTSALGDVPKWHHFPVLEYDQNGFQTPTQPSHSEGETKILKLQKGSAQLRTPYRLPHEM